MAGKENSGKVVYMRRKPAVSVFGLALAVIILLAAFLLLLVPVNIRSKEFWMTIFFALAAYAVGSLLTGDFQQGRSRQNNSRRGFGRISKILGNKLMFALEAGDAGPWKIILVPVAFFLVFLLLQVSGAAVFHAKEYASVLKVEDAEFTDDLPDASGTDSIALMDTASAQMLGDREIGSLSNVVSQYDVSYDYTQIDYQGSPLKVSPLAYAGFFKWINNKAEGVPGYVTVDPVSMSASYQETAEGMIYVPSAYFLQDAARHIYLSYPTLMTGNLHFEIDEDGNPYYVESVYKKTISLFGGTTVSGCIVMDPVTGDMVHYDLADVPAWVDVVYDGDIICTQYNWYGIYQNGFVNSLFGKKGCKQITVYSSGGDEESDDSEPASDYGYVAKDGDIWIYTGVTSVNSDSSNIGFLLGNERTGETHYFTVSGADEKSAMAAAEGEVQEKGYQASFPSLINVDGNPTYIMVLKDNSGLVKLYATVNVQQYNLVTTASTQKECLSKYRSLLGIAEAGGDTESAENGSSTDSSVTGGTAGSAVSVDAAAEEAAMEADGEADIVIGEIRDIDIDGNTYLYLISGDRQIYKALVKTHEDMLLLKSGDSVHLTLNGNRILTCEVR